MAYQEDPTLDLRFKLVVLIILCFVVERVFSLLVILQAAYLVPALSMLLSQGCAGGTYNELQSPEVVIVAPTRELAIQIHKESTKFSHNSVLRSCLVYGGTNVQHQVGKVQAGCNIVVATVGRLKDMVGRGRLDFSGVKFFILDEADRMLDMGFGGDIEWFACHPTMPPVVS